MGLIRSGLVFIHPSGKSSHRKCMPQLNPPRTSGEASYTKESWLMMSITGMATVVGSAEIRSSSGSSQSVFTSQWESKNTTTWKEEAQLRFLL